MSAIPDNSATLRAQLWRVEDLSWRECDAMYALLHQHFDGVKRDVFAADLAQKTWVILLEDPQHNLKGFSTLQFYQTYFGDKSYNIVYSGDTIVDPTAWQSSLLSRAWISTVNYLRQSYPGKLYWLLISSGYRTYRFLPTFWQEFYPRYDATTPVAIAALIDHLGHQQFQDDFDATTGIVKFSQPQVLRPNLLAIPAQRLQDPHIRFFRERNPGYVRGDELVCLTEIAEHNLTAAGQRMWSAQPSLAGEILAGGKR